MTRKTLVIPFLLLSVPAFAQEKSPYQTTAGGFEYRIIKDAPGETKAQIGDYLEMHIITSYKDDATDSLMFSSRKMNNGQPISMPLAQPGFNGDLMEGLAILTAGDSAFFRIRIDSMKKVGMQLLPFMKEGGYMQYYVQLISIKSAEVVAKEQKEKNEKQAIEDEKLLKDHLAQNKIKATKTASGLYYVITSKGKGDNAKAGDQVTVNYTGKLLNGEVFDSNLDPKFNHVEPFSFPLGQGRVIRGWDEGIALLNPGSKATLFIPSELAYGAQSPSPQIPANSILIFDVELIAAGQEAPAAGDTHHHQGDGHQH